LTNGRPPAIPSSARPDGDHGERYAELGGAERGRPDRAVAARYDDAVGCAGGRQRLERPVLEVSAALVGDLLDRHVVDVGAVGREQRLEVLGIASRPRAWVGDQGQAHVGQYERPCHDRFARGLPDRGRNGHEMDVRTARR
jgi:hypothetical protein